MTSYTDLPLGYKTVGIDRDVGVMYYDDNIVSPPVLILAGKIQLRPYL